MGATWGGRRLRRKPVVEGRPALDAADLRELGLLAPAAAGRAGTLAWPRAADRSSSVGYLLTLGQDAGTLRLMYALSTPAEDIDYPVRLVTTRCHLGGVRWWFACPLARAGVACGRRVRKLYLSGRYFGCRRCHDLTYTSTRQSDARVYAAVRGGLDLDRFARPGCMSVAELGLALKVLTFEQKRLDRLGDRLDRPRRRRAGSAVGPGRAGDLEHVPRGQPT